MSLSIEPQSTEDLLSRALQALDELLPEDWSTSLAAADVDPYADRRTSPDALLEIEAPDATTATFAVAAKMTLVGREVDSVLMNLRQYAERHRTRTLVVSRFLSSTARGQLGAHNVSFIDACGNLSVAASSPAISLFRPGLDRDPWRRTHTRQQLKGEPAARVVQTLFDLETPLKIADLIAISGTSPGAAYRVLDMLVEEGLAERSTRGWLDSVDRIGMLKRWAEDWASAASRFAMKFETLLGIERTLQQLAGSPKDSYVLGGGHAAALVADIAPPRTAVVHTDGTIMRFVIDGGHLIKRTGVPDLIVLGRGLDSAEIGAKTKGRLRLASPAQAYADLILCGDRAAAEKLLKSL